MRHVYDHAIYMHELIRTPELRKLVARTVRFLTSKKMAVKYNIPKFDAIAFTGNSGAIYAPPVALALNKPMILVRKSEVSSHSSRDVEGLKSAKTYIILDDIVSSGATVRRVVNLVHLWNRAECVGIVQGFGLMKPEEEQPWLKAGDLIDRC
jgi:adenine/guanine phosphoribosyltransferase-like PRPP-binding protein